MSFTSDYLDKISPIVPRSDTENFHDQTFYEQCLDVLMGVSSVIMRGLAHFPKSQISRVALFRFVRAFQNCQRPPSLRASHILPPPYFQRLPPN